MREPDFTVDQLIEHEKLFQQGLLLMGSERYEKAGQAFQASIALGDCLPQPWGNLGACLMMQEHYEESEAASFLSAEKPEIIGNDYLVIGTQDKPS